VVGGAGEQQRVGGELVLAAVGPGNSQSDPAIMRMLAGLAAMVHGVDSIFGDAASMTQWS
jgi:hypothetical protein